MAHLSPPPRPFRPTGLPDCIRIGALGLNAWFIIVVLPRLHGASALGASAILIPSILLPLVAGCVALAVDGHARRRQVAIVTLLLGFPALLAVGAGSGDVHGVEGAVFALLTSASVLAYGAVAVEACSRPLSLFHSTAQPLVLPRTHEQANSRSMLRQAVLGIMLVSAVVVAIVLPTLGDQEAMQTAWRGSLREGRVLSIIVGAGAMCVGIAGVVGPRLRSPRANEIKRPSRGARTATTILALGSTLALVILRWLETR